MVEGVAELVRELEDTSDEATIELAGLTLAEGPVEALRPLCAHGHPSVRRAALLALGRAAPPGTRSALEAALADAQDMVRRDACRALGALGDGEATPALCRAARDARPVVRAAAAEALGLLTTGAAVWALADLLREERAALVRAPAIAALQRAGARAQPVEREVALAALAGAAAREDDAALAGAALDAALELARGRSHPELLGALRRVPLGLRRALADGLAARDLDPTGPLARLVPELRALPADGEVLLRFGADLTQRARDGDAQRAFGRERELKLIRDRLSRPGPRSLVLVGRSGAGKTALIHELARQLAREAGLVPTTVLEATTGDVLSGTRFLGEWQTRLKELLGALRAPHRAIWYVPDVNRLIDAGTTVHSDESFASMLAPAVERGELVIVGESTPEAFRRGLDRHPAFARLFLKLGVEEPEREATLEILRAVADDLRAAEARRGLELALPEASVALCLDLAQDYFPALARPGNGVHLLREAVSAALEEHRDAAEAGAPVTSRVEVAPSRVLATLSHLSGVPGQLLDDAVPLDLEAVTRFFHERVLGQDEAVEAVVDLISLVKAGLTDPTRPLGVLFFVGPTGVGKTEMAKALAEFIFGSAERLVRIDLGEFKEPDAHRRLTGDPQAPDPAARFGLLTAPVRERPFSVVLLDEVEKAHRNVFDLLLPLMAEGRLVDEQGRVTDFRRTIIVMTSNLGSDLREDVFLGFGAEGASPEDGARAKVQRVMEEAFRPEFLNRIGKTVVFAPLTVEAMRQLTRREVRRVLSRRGITRRDVIVETDDAVIGILLREGFSERYGARPLKRRVEDLLLKPLARALLQLGPGDGAAIVRLGVQGERLVSEVIRAHDPDDEAPPMASRATARVRDAAGRLVTVDDLDVTLQGLFDRVVTISGWLEEQRLRERKRELLKATMAPDFWQHRARASAILSEVASIEQTLEAPGRLERRLQKLEALLGRAREQAGESRLLHDAVARTAEAERDVEFTEYAVRCPSAQDRGDAYLLLRRVDDEDFPEDVIKRMSRMFLRYARRKGFATQVVFEAVTRRGVVREAGLKLEGMCAYGLMRGEQGLHEWVARGEAAGGHSKRKKQSTFVRVSVLPPAEDALRPQDVTRERRLSREEQGVLIRKHRLHLVLTHGKTLVALDGGTDGGDDAEEEALAFLAARVAQASRAARDPGIVRRYVVSSQPLVRDLGSGLKAHLDRVLDGELDDFVLARVLGQ
ncbi:MAG: AAA family ATPase [Planctomycetes bacterium]|nr:AAA family ATPase [Planctomycetota bacterium]